MKTYTLVDPLEHNILLETPLSLLGLLEVIQTTLQLSRHRLQVLPVKKTEFFYGEKLERATDRICS